MKISCCSNNDQYSSPTIEVTENEIIRHKEKHTWNPALPRHLRSRESRIHRAPGAILRDGLAIPKICHFSCNQSEAFHILKYQLKDQQIQKTHLENVRRNLSLRLDKAKARGDQQLINLLNHESQQLELKALV